MSGRRKDLRLGEHGEDRPLDPGSLLPTDPALLTRLNNRGFRLVMLADAIVLSVIILGSMLWRFGLDWPSYPTILYLLSFATSICVFLAALYFGGLYEREPRLGSPPALPRAARQTLGAGGIVALLIIGLTGLARELGVSTERALPFPFANLVILIALGAVGVATNRWLVHRLRTRREGPPRVVVFGSSEERETARVHLGGSEVEADLVAELSDPSALEASVQRYRATDVVVLSSDALSGLYPAAVERLNQRGVTILLRVAGQETLYGLERIREVGGLPFVLLRAQVMPRSRARFKRAFDVTVLLLSAPFWLPVLLLMAAYMRTVVGSPLLYWQDRVGVGGRIFRMVKFRTMVPEAESDGLGARLASIDDDRVIPGCRWVRSTRLDELPQLWNVLRGEMSLVGPRPERPELIEGLRQRIPGYDRRHQVPPGITGLAQIHGHYHTDAEYKLGYDLQYLVNWSPVLDLQILLRTVWVVVLRRV